MAHFNTSSGESCHGFSRCYVSDTHSKSKFVQATEANDATSILRVDTFADDTAVPFDYGGRRGSNLVTLSIAVDESMVKKHSIPFHTAGEGLKLQGQVDFSLDLVGEHKSHIGDDGVSRYSSFAELSAANGASYSGSHADDTSKGNTAMIYLLVPGYREIQQKERLKRKASASDYSPGSKR